MSLLGVLRTGVSGMGAQTNRISTVAENVQNSGTTGYKRASTEFSSLLVDGGATGTYNSGAVETTVRRAVTEGGVNTTTTSTSDLAIEGNGFFVVQDPAGVKVLTRAGNFVKDGESGNYVNAAGFALTGYDLSTGPAVPTLNSTDGLVPVNMNQFAMQATASKSGLFGGNLDATATNTATTPPSTESGTATTYGYAKKTSILTYDPQGAKVTLDVYMTNNGANNWTARVYNASGNAWLATATLGFNASGQLATATAPGGGALTTTDIGIPVGGRTLSFDFSTLTNLAGDYSLKGAADGKAPSAVKSAQFDPDGTVYAVYDDGSRLAAFKVPVATVDSPDNLDPKAGNVYTTSTTSGDLQIGFAGAGGFGKVKSGSLEASNVDVSTELTAMIEAQTVYTANSKVFSTGNDLLEILMNLKR
ncbi:flagellar hook protein FlgE [Methylobacterium oryzihabitans]|uniref:Flagellar hook protein FlgE n=1 Tax=Methylobacterium oryzihabitans TaxID=2499852 RepID=A0A437PDC7_9HYPH|nr:flagellar hook protein FlgE [Methylobacterium oryzihabitans]RVU20277.1 flagellar hook protein FlgE [Methylobacterium oryzihabitans]